MQKFETPILFLVFNRPDNTRKVFEQIRKIKPNKLFIAADGPRLNVSEDIINCELVKNIVKDIDWDCYILTLFRDKNIGCGKAVSSALNWFFEHVEEGIILEDDCFPDISFFYYCQMMLEKYRYNKNIFSISGTNFNNDKNEVIYFARYMNMWGWATWRRSAELIDYSFGNWKKLRFKTIFLFSRTHINLIPDFDWINMWRKYFDDTSLNKIDTWDFQWIFQQLFSRQLTVYPPKNLVRNIGFSVNATHTTDVNAPSANLVLNKLNSYNFNSVKIENDPKFEVDFIKNKWFYYYKSKINIYNKLAYRIVRLFNRVKKIINYLKLKLYKYYKSD